MNTRTFGALVSRLPSCPWRIAMCARFRGEAASHSCCFRIAQARQEVGDNSISTPSRNANHDIMSNFITLIRFAMPVRVILLYASLPSIPEGVPTGVMVLLAAVIILRTTGAAWIRRCRNDARWRIAVPDLRSSGIGG
jgi:hypothetical protein